MSRMRIESLRDPSLSFDLGSIFANGFGVEALAGITGLGLPPVQLQWSEGAGDGATFRGRRVLKRPIDVPLHFLARTPQELREQVSKWTRLTADPMRIWFVDGANEAWYADVHRAGGGDYAYGIDTTGDLEMTTVVTLEAGDPFWTAEVADRRTISRENVGRGLIKDTVGGSTGADSLIKLRLSGSTVAGTVILENSGDVDAFPLWEIQGPGSDIVATGPDGTSWSWTGTLAEGETLFVDSRTARVTDDTGTSRYAELGPAPRFWVVPHGISNANITMTGTGLIIMSWKRRKWAVI